MIDLALTLGAMVVLGLLLWQAPARHERWREGQVTRVMVEEGLDERAARDALWEREQW